MPGGPNHQLCVVFDSIPSIKLPLFIWMMLKIDDRADYHLNRWTAGSDIKQIWKKINETIARSRPINIFLFQLEEEVPVGGKRRRKKKRQKSRPK